eukprot:4367219-Prymnesium_polylepis.3
MLWKRFAQMIAFVHRVNAYLRDGSSHRTKDCRVAKHMAATEGDLRERGRRHSNHAAASARVVVTDCGRLNLQAATVDVSCRPV